MRIDLNLAIAESARERYGLVCAVPIVALGLVGLLLLSSAAARNFRQYRPLHRAVLEVEERERTFSLQVAALKRELQHPRFRQLSREAGFMNSLIERRHLSVAELIARTTRLLPHHTRLRSLGLSQEGPEPVVRFTLLGRDEQSTEEFLRSLEDSSDFQDVTVLSQGFERSGAGGDEIVLTCTARYAGGVLPRSP